MSYNFGGSSWLRRGTFTQNVPVTLACLARPTATIGPNVNLVVILNTANSDSIGLALQTKFFAYSYTQSGGVAQSTSSASVIQNQWQHFCGVFSSSSSRISYLDGVASTENTTSRAVAGLQNLDISAFNGGDRFTGQIAEVGVWDAGLNSSEVKSLSLGIRPSKIRPQNLVFYAPLVRNLYDYRQGASITNNNTATSDIHSRVYA